MEIGLLVLRVVVGGLIAGHGAQKLFGWFGGHGPDGTGGFMESLGLRPGRPNAIAAGASELAAGVLLALGLLTPLAALLLTAVMVTAMLTAHRGKGPWVTEGGWEYNAVLVAIAFAIVAVGPGSASLDAALDVGAEGLGWALAAVALGAAGAFATVTTARSGALDRRPRPPRGRPTQGAGGRAASSTG